MTNEEKSEKSVSIMQKMAVHPHWGRRKDAARGDAQDCAKGDARDRTGDNKNSWQQGTEQALQQ
jgi:hypothetical protein